MSRAMWRMPSSLSETTSPARPHSAGVSHSRRRGHPGVSGQDASHAVTLALAGADVAKAESTLSAAGLKATMRHDLALVAVRAASMRDLSGVMVAIADALYEAGARLYGDRRLAQLRAVPDRR